MNTPNNCITIRPPHGLVQRYQVRRSACLAAALMLVAVSVAGSRQKEPDMPPVATPSVTFSRDRVALGSPVKLTYRSQVAANATFDGTTGCSSTCSIPDGEQLWTDDHLPPTPTTQWKPGQTVEYTRTVFVPNYPYIGEAKVRIGLYSQADGKRLALAAPERRAANTRSRRSSCCRSRRTSS